MKLCKKRAERNKEWCKHSVGKGGKESSGR